MVSWAIQKILTSFNFSEFHTAYSIHYTETIWFKHHHCSPDACVKFVIQCVLKPNSFIRNSLFDELTREGHALNTEFYLSFFMIPVFIYLSYATSYVCLLIWCTEWILSTPLSQLDLLEQFQRWHVKKSISLIDNMPLHPQKGGKNLYALTISGFSW